MQLLKGVINSLANPRLFFLMSVAGLVFMIWKREVFSRKAVGYGLLGFLALFLVFGYFDPNFQLIILKPDNVPNVGLIFLIVFFTWYSIRQGVLNDQRIARGEGPIEKQESDRVWVWPDLVYTELISLILCSVVLIVWSIVLEAPLEQPASQSATPNPSKAPWYFLGLQEMLVYFDPWLAGVVLPTFIIIGLIAIPYIDKNQKGNGYYTVAERKAEIFLFLLGFVVLWCSDTHKLEALTNVNLAEYIWVRGLGVGQPSFWLTREIFGILLVLAYVFVLPVLFARTIFKNYYAKMGPGRYYVGVFLFLMMMSLPVKMLLRWIFNLKYIVGIPEFFFNI
jgi:hypothetical protein